MEWAGGAVSGESIEARVARLEEAKVAAERTRIDRDREIRDIKTVVTEIDAKLDRLIADKNQRDGAIGLGKWLVGTGFFALVGSAVLATLHYIGLRGGTP